MNSDRLDRDSHATISPWLASLMMRRGSPILPRFALHYQRLSGRSRGWRRRLQRKLAVTVTGAALLLAMSGVYAQTDPTAPDATITVVNGQVAVSNNGQCSLIEAINNANSTTTGQPHADCTAGNPGGADTIVLPSGGDFVLTAVNNTQFGANGLPVFNSTITINGNGATIRRGAGAPSFRIGLSYYADLTLNNVTISNGHAGGWGGGAIYQYRGDLTITNSTIINNTGGNGGAISVKYGYSTTITNSQITNNTATSEGGGLYLHDAPTTINGSTISGNEAGTNGGGIQVYNFSVDITNSTISNNAADIGGGLFGEYAEMNISRSTISNNDAYSAGGGIYSRGQGSQSLTLSRSTVSGNFGILGGGLYLKDGDDGIVNSTISGNDAEYGGGIFIDAVYSGSLRNIANSTITGNSATYHGGGLDIDSPTNLNRSIIAGNTAGSGDEIVAHQPVNASNRNLFGRAGVNNAAAFVGFLPGATDINATSNGINTPLANILSPLGNNGGPTQTHPLPAGSPARDVAPNTSCNNSPISGIDQRGEPRNQNGAGGAGANECDLGAYEAAAGAPPAAGAFYISTAKAGTMGGVGFAPADIIKFDPANGWSMYFDGSDVGITKNVAAFEIQNDGSILLSLQAPQSVVGVGTVAPQDVLRFVPTATGNNTTGTFQMWVDGSTVGLSTSGEKIDALGLTGDGRIVISTSGAASVPVSGGTLKSQDEDAAGFNRNTAAWTAFLDGTAIAGLAAEDVNALWVNTTTGDIYISIVGAFNLGGVSGDGQDIVKLTPSGGSYTPSLHWDGSAAGFPTTIDGLEIVP